MILIWFDVVIGMGVFEGVFLCVVVLCIYCVDMKLNSFVMLVVSMVLVFMLIYSVCVVYVLLSFMILSCVVCLLVIVLCGNMLMLSFVLIIWFILLKFDIWICSFSECLVVNVVLVMCVSSELLLFKFM